MKKITLLTILLSSLSVGPTWAGSVGGFGGATEVTQWANNALLGKQLDQQIQQYVQMVQSVQTQLKQLEALKTAGQSLTENQWGDAISSLRKLNQVVQGSQGISYSMQNVDQSFQTRYPGYEDTLIKQMRQNGQTPAGYGQRVELLNNGVIASARGSMAAAGYQSQQFDSENSLLDSLKSQSNNAVGQMQAIQAGNQISGFMVDELRKQRQLNMSSMQAQNNWIAYQAQTAALEKEKSAADRAKMTSDTDAAITDSLERSRAAVRAAFLK